MSLTIKMDDKKGEQRTQRRKESHCIYHHIRYEIEKSLRLCRCIFNRKMHQFNKTLKTHTHKHNRAYSSIRQCYFVWKMTLDNIQFTLNWHFARVNFSIADILNNRLISICILVQLQLVICVIHMKDMNILICFTYWDKTKPIWLRVRSSEKQNEWIHGNGTRDTYERAMRDSKQRGWGGRWRSEADIETGYS